MINKRQGSKFTFMVVGSRGSGKSSFLNSLINKEIVRQSSTTQIDIYLLNLDFNGVAQKFTFIDTPGFGHSIDDTDLQDSIVDYIKDQFDSYIEEETKIRRNVKYEDTRVHALVYLISATGNGLKPRDIVFLQKVCNFVNIIPVISKTEGMSKTEIIEVKELIRKQLKHYNIKTFDFENEYFNPEEDIGSRMNELFPFACVFPETIGESRRIRTHPLLVCEVDNPLHTDYTYVREAILSTHTNSLIEVTDAELYEKYRTEALENILKE